MYHFLIAQDIIEIILYSSVLYSICIWLKTDTTKNLLVYFLSYCTLTIVAWTVPLPTLLPLLTSYAPILLLLFIIFHEKTLQRNFVALHNHIPKQSKPQDWIDTVLSSSLHMINNNKNVSIVIENQHSLEHFLTVPFFINVDIHKEILDLFFASNSYDEKKILWINNNGVIRSFNGVWNTINEEKTSSQKIHLSHDINSLFYTFNTDAIVCNAYHLSRTFTLIINGKEITNLSAQQVKTLLTKQLMNKSIKEHKGTFLEKNSFEKHPI